MRVLAVEREGCLNSNRGVGHCVPNSPLTPFTFITHRMLYIPLLRVAAHNVYPMTVRCSAVRYTYTVSTLPPSSTLRVRSLLPFRTTSKLCARILGIRTHTTTMQKRYRLWGRWKKRQRHERVPLAGDSPGAALAANAVRTALRAVHSAESGSVRSPPGSSTHNPAGQGRIFLPLGGADAADLGTGRRSQGAGVQAI
jgi:hypothetical protein